MRLYILILIFFLIGLVFSQERMQGTYTIGGTNPDFASVQESADSLMSKGVSGPVTFNIRPGLYEEAGGTERVLFVDQSIPGISGTNMITYRSDEAEGGNANNVIFQRTAQVGSPAGYVVEISYGYMHFRDLTFQNADTTSEDTAPSIFHIMPNTNFSADSVFIENCQFIGDAGNRRSYDGIKWNRNFNNMHFDNNYIRGCNNGIRHYLLAGTNQSKGVVITNNYITGLQRYSYGGSGIGGWGIRLVESDSAVVSGNTLDYQSGGSGRYGYVLGCNYLTFEKNKIIGLRQSPEFKGIALEGSNNKIYNNMLAGISSVITYGIQINGSNNEIYFNSVAIPARDIGPSYNTRYSKALFLDSGSNNTIKNNIFVNYSYNDEYIHTIHQDYEDISNVYDSNILQGSPSTNFTRRIVQIGSNVYSTLEEWQSTGNGTNSKYFLPEFVNINNDLHITGCSLDDPNMQGIPIEGITLDVDGDVRDAQYPLIGSDESTESNIQRFEPIEHIAAGEIPLFAEPIHLNEDGAAEMIVANANSKNIFLYMNDGQGDLTLFTSFGLPAEPLVVKAADFNNDGHEDFIATIDSAEHPLVIFWGQGSSTFAPFEYVSCPYYIDDVETGDIDNDGDIDLVLSYLGIIGVDSGYVFIIPNEGDQTFGGASHFYRANRHPSDLILANVNQDSLLDVAVVDNADEVVSVLLNQGNNLEQNWHGFADVVTYQAFVESGTLLPGFVAADFDSDNDIDLMIDDGASKDSVVLLRNNGDGTFANREAIYMDDFRQPSVFTTLDYENDGDPDLITGSQFGDIVLYLNDGYANFNQALLCTDGKASNEPRVLLTPHLNSDDHQDVFSVNWTSGGLIDTLSMMLNLGDVTSAFNKDTAPLIEKFELEQNFPNPFNPVTTIPYRLNEKGNVHLTIYNILGQEIYNKIIENQQQGYHEITWDGKQFSSGLYFYQLKFTSSNKKTSITQTKRMMLIK